MLKILQLTFWRYLLKGIVEREIKYGLDFFEILNGYL